MLQPRPKIVDRIHSAGIVYVVGGDQRSIQRTWPGSVEQLKHKAAGIGIPVKDAIDPEILGADVGAEIFPLGIVGIGWRLHGVRPNVTEGAGHSNPIGLYQVFVLVELGVFVISLAVAPLSRCRLIKVGIGEKPQPDDAGRIAVIGAQRKILTSRANGDTRILLLVLKRIGRAVGYGATLVQPQAIALRVRTSGFVEARLIDEPEIFPAIVAAILWSFVLRSMVGRKCFQEIQSPEAGVGNPIPETIVAAGPNDPGIAPFDLIHRQR